MPKRTVKNSNRCASSCADPARQVAACGVCRTDLHLLDGELQGAAVLVMKRNGKRP